MGQLLNNGKMPLQLLIGQKNNAHGYNTAYTRPPGAVGADSSQLFEGICFGGYFSAFKPVARVYA